MENLFEAIMLCCLCVGMAVMIVRFARQKSVHLKLDRAIVITFGVGFVLGAIGKAVIFSFPQFGEKNEVSENE